MKKGILICITLLASVAGLAQPQITDFNERALFQTSSELLGTIGDEVFVMNTNRQISKISLKTKTIQKIYEGSHALYFKALISHNRLFCAYFNSSEKKVTINEIDPEKGTVLDEIIIKEAIYLYASEKMFYVLMFGSLNSIQQVSFTKDDYHIRPFFSSPSFIFSEISEWIIRLTQKDGTQVFGFVDKDDVFHETGDTGASQKGTEFSDYYVFLPSYNLNKAYVFSKKTGKTHLFPVSDSGLALNLQFFEHNRQLYAIAESKRSYIETNKNKYTVYKYDDHQWETLFSEDISTNMFYIVSNPAIGALNTYSYSNVLVDGSQLYFWGNDSLNRNSGQTLNFYSINLETKIITSKSITESGINDSLQFTYPPYGFHLTLYDHKVVTTTNLENHFGFGLNPDTRAFESLILTSQKNVTRINDSLSLNLSYPQKIILENARKEVISVLEDKAYYNTNAVQRYFNTGDKLVIPTQNWDFYTFDGEELHLIGDEIKKDFTRINWKYWTGTNILSKHVLYIHGLKNDGTTGGNFYTFDIKTEKVEKFYSFQAPYLNMYTEISKPENSPFILLNFDGNRVVITNFKEFYSLKSENTNAPAWLIHSFSNHTFILNPGDNNTYFYNPSTGLRKLLAKGYLYKTYGSGEFFYFMEGNTIKVVNSAGEISDLFLGNPDSFIHEVSGDMLYCAAADYVGVINKSTGKIMGFRLSKGDPRLYEVFKIEDSYYGFSFDDEIYRLDFKNGKLRKLSNERFSTSMVKSDTTAYLYNHYADSEGKKGVWKLNHEGLKKIFDAESWHTSDYLGKPFVYRGKDPGKISLWDF